MGISVKRILGLLIVLLIYACTQNEGTSLKMADGEQAAFMPEEQPEIDLVRKLIKEGRVEFETDDLATTKKRILSNVEKYKGYISSDQEYRSTGQIRNTLIIRVPADNFDPLLNEATKGVSKFENKEIQIKDVTEEFLDVQARLKTKKELENRYLELLKKANSVTEILEVETQMGQLRSDIESIEGRLKYLESQVSLSTLTMSFYQSVPDQKKFGNRFKNGFKNGWDNLIGFFVLLTHIWPFILIGIGFLFGIRAWVKRK